MCVGTIPLPVAEAEDVTGSPGPSAVKDRLYTVVWNQGASMSSDLPSERFDQFSIKHGGAKVGKHLWSYQQGSNVL